MNELVQVVPLPSIISFLIVVLEHASSSSRSLYSICLILQITFRTGIQPRHLARNPHTVDHLHHTTHGLANRLHCLHPLVFL